MKIKSICNSLTVDARSIFFLYVFSIPIFNYNGYNAICNMLFFIFVITAISSRIINFNRYCVLMAIFPIFAIASTIFTGVNDYSLKLCYSCVCMLIVIVLMTAVLQGDDILKVENAVILGSFVLVIVDVYIFLTNSMGSFRLGTATVNTNNMGIALAFSSLFVFDRISHKKNSNDLILFGVIEILVLLTQSRSALIFSLMGAIIIWFSKKHGLNRKISKCFFLGVIVVTVTLVIGVASGLLMKFTTRFHAAVEEITLGNNIEGSAYIRMNLKSVGYNEFLEKPIVGHGFGTTANCLNGGYFHDNYIQLLYEVGLIGLIAFLFPLIIMLISAIKNKNGIVMAFIIGILIEGVFDVYYHNKLYYLIFGLCIVRLKQDLLKRKNNEVVMKVRCRQNGHFSCRSWYSNKKKS